MTELKPLEIVIKEIKLLRGIFSDNWENLLHKNDIRPLLDDKLLAELEQMNTRPQSLTEKVKWPHRDICYCGSHCSCIPYHEGVEDCKKALNQASQEDRGKGEHLISVLKWLNDYIGEENEECLKLIEKTLKEYDK